MELHDEGALITYSDGSMFSKPRRQGGIGIRLIWTNLLGHEEHFDYNPPGFFDVSVPLMELKAVIEAVRLLTRKQPPVPPSFYRKIVVYSDAMYMVEGHPRAKGAWPANKWMTQEGTPVKNAEEWKELLRLEKRIGKRFEIRKVRGTARTPTTRRSTNSHVSQPRSPATRPFLRQSCAEKRVRNVWSPAA